MLHSAITPFWGISRAGRTVSRILNRLLILTELGILGFVAYTAFAVRGHSLWWLLLGIPAALFAIEIVGTLIRVLCIFVLGIIYGTFDAEQIRQEMKRRKVSDKADVEKRAKKNAEIISSIKGGEEINTLKDTLRYNELVEAETYLLQHPRRRRPVIH